VKQQHTATATAVLTAKCTDRSLSAQRLSERTVFSVIFDVEFIKFVIFIAVKDRPCFQVGNTVSFVRWLSTFRRNLYLQPQPMLLRNER
jgi:hypothetical protein